MKFFKGLVVSVILMVFFLCAVHAEALPIPGIFNTGVDNSDTLLAGGATDQHYTVGPSPSGPDAMVVIESGYPFPYWFYNGPSSAWIAPSANGGSVNTAENYTYRTTFDLTGFDFSSAVITGQWVSDNSGIDILINGISSGATNDGAFGSYSGFTAFTITSGFVAGLNTLDFIVNNASGGGGSGNPTGLRVEVNGTANSTTVPEPATMFLFGLGLIGLAGLRRKFQK